MRESPQPPLSPLRRFLARLESLGPDRIGGRVRAVETLSPRESEHREYPLPPAGRAILRRRGIEALYRHQVEALLAWREGRDVLLATGTASGKSLVYNLAAAGNLLESPGARALFLFPLKALERDQLSGLRADLAVLPPELGARAEIYDGDTSPYQRKRIREDPPSVLLSTPDMLHAGVLPMHAGWREFLAGLRLVVIDEVHTYRGVLGAHVAQVVRRLLRVAAHYGAAPQLMACSATVGNPARFGRELLGREVAVVEREGSPRPALHYVFVEPELSPYTAASRLFRLCVREGLRTIAFTQARRATELMHAWVIEAEPELAARISSYRSGFLPEERREIEQRLFSGELAGVISTSALELGIDVGGLDACLLVGYPGSLLATRQRAGRVGRAREGLVFVIPREDALDRYFLRHPRELLERPCEEAVLDAANEEILAGHLPCAAAELPLREPEPWLGEARVAGALAEAARRGVVLESAAGGEWFAARPRPAREVSLRSVGEAFAIRRSGEAGRRGVIGTVGGGRVFAECHPGAIYLHRAQSFRVRRLDLVAREVEVEGPLRVDYYTRALAEKETEILEVRASRPLGNALAKLGRLRITQHTTRYEQRRVFGQDLLASHPLELPPRIFETEGLWLELAPEIEDAIAASGGHFMGAIHGLEHATLALFPLFALCDRLDVAGISIPRHPQVRGPAVFLYDGVPGGIGIARALHPRLEELLAATREAVASCACAEGCPSCVHSPRCSAGNRPLDKRATVQALDLVLARAPLPPLARGPRPEPAPRAPAAAAAARPQPAALYLDVETQRSAQEVGGWHNTHLMRLAVAVVCDGATDRFECYSEARAHELVERLFRAPLVIGFNVRRFDYRVLSAYSARSLDEIPTFDVFEDLEQRLGRKIGLGHLGLETLARTKTGNGLQSLEWFRQGDLARVEAYCRADVELLRDLVRFGEQAGHVVVRRRDGIAVRVPVAWDGPTLHARAAALARR